jgi:hypothetical protein
MNYQKYISALLLVILITVLSIGCSDTLTQDSKNPVGKGKFNPFLLSVDSDSLDGIFYLDVSTLRSGVPQYYIQGYVFKGRIRPQRDTLISGGILTVADRVIDSFYTGGHLYQWMPGIGSDNTLPTFNATATWSLSGNPGAGVDSFTTTLTSPKIVNITAPTPYEIPKDSGIQVQWNSDSYNAAGVMIVVMYKASTSRRESDSTLTSADISYTHLTNDDGSYTISSSDLSSFPKGGIIDIYVLRATSKNVPVTVNGKNYFIAAVARSVSEHKLY